MANLPEDYREGDEQSASWLNGVLAWLRRNRLIQGPGIKIDSTPNGQVVSAELPQEKEFRIVSGVNPYAGVEVYALANGDYATRPGGHAPTVSSDPLRERSKNTAVPGGTIVLARRTGATGAWYFSFSACSTTASPTPTLPTNPPRSNPSGSFASSRNTSRRTAKSGPVGTLGGRPVGGVIPAVPDPPLP